MISSEQRSGTSSTERVEYPPSKAAKGGPAWGAISISQRVSALVVVCFLLLLVVAGFAYAQLDRISSLAAVLGQNSLPGVQRALDERLSVAEYRAAELRILSEPNNRPAVLADLAKARESVERTLPSLQDTVSTTPEQAAFEDFKATWALYLRNSDSAIKLAQNKQWDDAWTLLTGESQKQQVKMHQALTEVSRLKSDVASHQVIDAIEARSRALVVIVLCTAAGLVLTVALGLLLSRSITRPLHQAIEVATSVAEGDLVKTVAVEGPREIQALLDRLRRMQASLRRLVGTVREGAEGMHSISDVVARGSRDLSSRTDLQAGQVSAVVDTMHELRSTVSANAFVVQESGILVADAYEVARRGGVAVQRVVTTMSDIHDASQRIATIVDLTKNIAFQTDILAVNAAVEAARAAGQGRAFAVVASEVRALAKRSALAAQEIAKLISSSVERVSAGAAEVEEAGRTMREIVSQVESVSVHMRRIGDSTRAQSEGIGAVDVALMKLHDLTQENLALVDQNRSASDDLQARSEGLGATVAVFRLTA